MAQPARMKARQVRRSARRAGSPVRFWRGRTRFALHLRTTFATVSMQMKLADEVLGESNVAKKLGGYRELVTEYNEAIQETVRTKGD